MNLESEHLLIRPFQEKDIPSFMNYRNDMEWMKYQSFKGLSCEEYEKFLLADQNVMEGMQLAVVLRSNGELIGDIYLKKDDRSYWIGYTICPSQARKGYAFEAVSCVMRYLSLSGAAEIKADVDPSNKASIGLLNKLQFRQVEANKESIIFILSLKEGNDHEYYNSSI